MTFEKSRIPDVLTSSRALIGLVILLLIPVGEGALPLVLWLLLVGWTTDLLDGRVARRLEVAPSTIGRHEFEIDMSMVLCSGLFLVATGLVPPVRGAGYLALATCAAVFSHSRAGHFLKFKALTMALAVPWVFGPFVIAYFRGDRLVAYAGLGWICMALVLSWRRFLGVVEDFVDGARAFLRREGK